MNKIWNDLLEYESRDLLDRYYRRRFNLDLSASKAHQIAANFIQAREYFRNAESSSITVKPLLQYYGVLGLSRGLILALKPDATEAQLKSSHGLEINDWQSAIKNSEFESLEITIKNGTFSELMAATKNQSYLRAGSTSVNMLAPANFPPNESTITLKQIMPYFPDLSAAYHSWLQEDLLFAIVKSPLGPPSGPTVKVVLEGHLSDHAIESFFPQELCTSRRHKVGAGLTIVEYDNPKWSPNVTQMWDGALDIGSVCTIPMLKDDMGFNLLTAMYVMSYVFGMMARYYPSTWISLQRVEKGDKLLPFMHQVLLFIAEKFPRQVVDFLKAPYPNET